VALSPWRFLARAEAFRTRIYRIHEERWVSPRTGREGHYAVLDCADFVNVVAVDTAGMLVLIRQFRFATRTFTLEIPGGMADPGEAPDVTAVRELREETGYAAPRGVLALGSTQPNSAIMSNRSHFFVAEGVQHEGAQLLDPGEDIEIVRMPVDEALGRLYAGEFENSLTALALHRYDLYRSGKLSLR
jgi:ADP-ribose pyrophosphatase